LPREKLVCKCPKCGKVYLRKLRYCGRGTVRKYCPACATWMDDAHPVEVIEQRSVVHIDSIISEPCFLENVAVNSVGD
jgi:hypothetical protein